MKVVDTNIYLANIVCILEENYKVVIPVSGNSMSPFLCGGRDFVMLEKPSHKERKRGQIVLYKRAGGQFVLHRIQKMTGSYFYAIGDGQTKVEGPLSLSQICAKVCMIQRKGKWISGKDFWSCFFKIIWIRVIPLRRVMIKIWAVLSMYGKK